MKTLSLLFFLLIAFTSNAQTGNDLKIDHLKYNMIEWKIALSDSLGRIVAYKNVNDTAWWMPHPTAAMNLAMKLYADLMNKYIACQQDSLSKALLKKK